MPHNYYPDYDRPGQYDINYGIGNFETREEFHARRDKRARDRAAWIAGREQREAEDRLERLRKAKEEQDRRTGERMAWWVLFGIPVPVTVLSAVFLLAGGMPFLLALVLAVVLGVAASFVSGIIMSFFEPD